MDGLFYSEVDIKHPSGDAPIRRHLRRYPIALRQLLLWELNQLVTYEPVIGIMGKTGVGKSSLCNALFRSEVCAVNAVTACTRQAQRMRLRFWSHYLTLMDLPGVGESVTRDDEYRELYRELMPQLDMVLWVLKADDRAFSVEEQFYQAVFAQYTDQLPPVLWGLTRWTRLNLLSSRTGRQRSFPHFRRSVSRRSGRPWPARWGLRSTIFAGLRPGALPPVPPSGGHHYPAPEAGPQPAGASSAERVLHHSRYQYRPQRLR